MNELIEGLRDLVSDSLYEMTWHCDFPINQNVGLWCFLEAFRTFGAHADFDKTEAVFLLNRTMNNKPYVLQAVMNKEEIIRGWGNHPAGSPRTLYDSICEVYDRMGKDLSRIEDKNAWSN